MKLLGYKIIYVFLILLSIVTFNEIAAQKNHNETITFVDPFGKFSIDYPSDWDAIAPGHRFEEGNLDLIIQKPDKKQGYIEIQHEEIISKMKKSNEEENSLISSSFLTNNSLEDISSSLFKDYIYKLNLQNFKYIKKFYYDKNFILCMNTT